MNTIKISLIAFFILLSFGLSAESISDSKDGKTAFVSGKISDNEVQGANQVRFAHVCLISGQDSVWTTTSTW